ncbi:TrmB family transcriptional regulator [Paenibacillus rhizosphaerae]|uniref:TrmB family transcriptional regulator n=1 Tax=Paenibacillus rhizosphaerae TaxID=297318 RepID=A0A1R1EK73_9BACL|nr:TrmB family transcriptional regulator [Paenibacillus rhizosphaerae]OMF52224.1 TrmB family transcriptional regulator [Paenibacillus rhizosphaerae]
MIEQLRSLGLSDLEARIYLVLHEEPHLSGYEVAKRVSVSRTNVYAALRVLTDKGFCRSIEADPVLYDAVPIGQLIRMLKSQFEQTAKALVEELDAPPKAAPAFYTWKGEQALQTAIRRLIANADRSIVVDIWSEDVHWVEEALMEAQQRGINVILITIGEAGTGLSNVIVHQRSEEWAQVISRKFSVLCDGRAALIGSFGKSLKLSALETDHPSVIELLNNAFFHDVIADRIEQDFGRELEEKYGRHYERIIGPYRGMLE